MATAEELLNSLSNTETYSDDPGIFVINDEDRTIDVPSKERLFGVTGDKDVERKYFQCPKIVGDNIDLSQHQIYISYVFTTSENNTIFPTIGNGRYHCEDVEVSGDNITFSWLLSGNVLSNPGFIAFKVMAMKNEGDELKTKWNTAPAFGTVLITVPDGEDIAEEYPDVIAQIFDRLDALESGGGTGGTTNYENLSNKPQLNGVTLEGNKTLDQVGVLAKNQGSSNSGKYLSVGSDGNVVPADAPSGGTVDPEQIEQAVNGYLEENPVSGMTAEQKQQLNQNTQDVTDLKSALPDKLDTNQGAENKGKSMVVGEDGGIVPVEFDINGKEMDISIDGSNTLIELLQKICDKLQIKYGIKLYSNYLGFVTPMDGAYSDWVYNNMYPIDGKIYFSYMFPQTHWNQKKDERSRMCVYDTKTKTYEYWERICEGESFAASATIYDPDDATFYSFNSDYRFKSPDNGRTWEKESISGMPNSPHYLTRLSNGDLIVAPDSTTLHQFAKSSDKGLTWSTFNPFSLSYNLSHCRFYEVEDGTVVAYFFNPYISDTKIDRSSESTRYFAVSTDYGETWSEPEKCQGDLEKAGVSYMTGAFAYYGGVYHYITAERLPETDKPDKIGRIRWFSGTKEELLTGNLKLVEEIDSVVAKSLNGNNGWNSTSISDSGNIGCCVGADGLYVIFGSILDQFYTTASFICSNQGLKMFRLGTSDIGNKTDEYYDETQMERLNKLYSEKSKDHTFYIFDDQTTNIEGVELFGNESQYAIPKIAKKIIPVGTGDFEVNAIFTFKNFGITNDLWSSYAPYMPIGFQTSAGTLHGFLGKETNQYGFNAGSTDTSSNPFMLACGNGKAYITIKRESGHLFFTLNGATITDPVYDNYAYKESYMLPEVTQDSLVWNYEPGSEEGAFLNFLDSNSADWNKKNIVSGFKMLTIDIPSF